MDSFDVVRRWFAAFNHQDLDALVALYHDDCVNMQNADVWQGREGLRQFFEQMFARLAGGFEGGVRRTVRSIGYQLQEPDASTA